MTIRREDLAAAAALGLLQYRQIDPLLVFLLQRDLHAQRQAMLRARERRRGGVLAWLTFGAAALATIAGVMFALVLTTHGAGGPSAAAWLFVLAYLGSAYGALALAHVRGYGMRVRLASAALVATIPVAVFALQEAA